MKAVEDASYADARRMRGKGGEDAAARLLERSGMRILARNWRCGRLELDVVCQDGETLVFVEVRTRSRGGLVSPAESLTPAKRRNFMRAARAYLAKSGEWDRPCRFDFVCVLDAGATLELEHHRHVDLTEFMGGGNTSWQPW